MKKLWTQQDRDRLRSLYPDNPAKEVANILGRSVASIYDQAHLLGLTKSEAFLNSPASGRTGDCRGKSSRFVKGRNPWNSGTSYQPGGRSMETRFKKRRPQESLNYQPIGSFRITKDGILQQKYTDDHPQPAQRWRAYHRIVWEKANGDVPAGHICVFKPGQASTDPEQVTLDKIECISRAENMRRNTIQNYPPELKSAMRLVGKLRRKISEKSN